MLGLALESPSNSNSQPYKVAIASGETSTNVAKQLTENYWCSSTIQRESLPKKLFSLLTNDSIPDSYFKPILGRYPDDFQRRRVETGKGLYKVLGIERQDKKAHAAQMALNFSFSVHLPHCFFH